MFRFFIPVRLPGLNEYTNANRRNKYAGAKIKAESENQICLFIRSKLRGVQIDNPVFIRYTWHEENRKRDLDNICFAKKFIQDALVKEGVLRNDGWANIVGFEDRFEVLKGNCGVLVEIVEVRNRGKKNENDLPKLP